MRIIRSFDLIVVMLLVGAACGSKGTSSSRRDGAIDQTGDADGQAGGADGSLAQMGGSGGSIGGAGGSGGMASDALLLADAPASGDADPGCGPGYPLNSQRPQGDGCNTCYCEAGGSWQCTTKACPPPADAAAEVAADAGCTGSGCSTVHDAAQDRNPMCGTLLCGSAQFCCASPCAACMPTAESCASLVCGTGDGGTYESYPSDCTPAYSGDSTFCGVVSPATPHSIHFYQCTTSVLASPCSTVSLGTVGGSFCCPGASY